MLAGNQEAFAEIVKRYEQRVRGYCYAVLSDYVLAQDAAQEIFIKVYESLEKFQGKSSFSTWLYRISANHCTDLIRKRARHPMESWEALLNEEGENIESQLASPREIKASENNELIVRLLSLLPENLRTVLVLREIEGLSYQELTQTLSCSLDAVKSRLKRARQLIEEKARHFLKAENV